MEDLALTGQHVPTIAALVDVICPMIYPSHFGPGFEGRKRPGRRSGVLHRRGHAPVPGPGGRPGGDPALAAGLPLPGDPLRRRLHRDPGTAARAAGGDGLVPVESGLPLRRGPGRPARPCAPSPFVSLAAAAAGSGDGRTEVAARTPAQWRPPHRLWRTWCAPADRIRCRRLIRTASPDHRAE